MEDTVWKPIRITIRTHYLMQKNVPTPLCVNCVLAKRAHKIKGFRSLAFIIYSFQIAWPGNSALYNKRLKRC